MSVSDIELELNLIMSFNIDINFVFVFDFVFHHFSCDLIDNSAGNSISDLTDDSAVEASTQLMIHEAEKDFVI